MNNRLKDIGLALLLVGMELLQEPMSNLDQYPNFLHAISTLSDYGFWSILIFIAIGALLTCLVQASAAMMAITLVMCYNGWIGFDVAVALVMGQNIGTTITANLAALVANTAGKKAARAHLVFNVVGVIITLIVFSPLMNFIAFLTENMTGCSPYAPVDDPLYNRESVPLAISLFHTIFNVGNTIILAFFIPQILKIVDWMVKTKVEDTEDEFRLTYIEGNWLANRPYGTGNHQVPYPGRQRRREPARIRTYQHYAAHYRQPGKHWRRHFPDSYDTQKQT